MKKFVLVLMLSLILILSSCNNTDQQNNDTPSNKDATVSTNLIVKNISVGFSRNINQDTILEQRGVNAVLCNNGPSNNFDSLIELKQDTFSNNLHIDKHLNNNECYSELVPYAYLGISAPGSYDIIANSNSQNVFSKTIKVPSCGNYQCENDESFDSCPSDCDMPCKSSTCNDKVSVYCGCSEYDLLSRKHACVGRAGQCNNCDKQELLFNDYLNIQTKVYDCLSNYFDYNEGRVAYLIYRDSPQVIEPCTEREGCSGSEGGLTTPSYILFHNLNGFHAYNENQPTKPEYLTADKHETVHFMLHKMLHSIPIWFHEAIAFQTTERLVCNPNENPQGDAYLSERDGDTRGVKMDDGTYLNSDFYKRLKNSRTTLSTKELTNTYITASLFITGLKEDYNCEKECIAQIVKKLKEYEEEGCKLGTRCGIDFMTGQEKENINNEIIKQKVEEVTGRDTTPLFRMLELI